MRFLTTSIVLLAGCLSLASASTTSNERTTSSSTKVTQPTPPACPKGSFEVTSFTWFNSSHNLDCPLASDPDCLCCTGKPLQPPGYGPPDYVSFKVRNVATDRSSQCIYQNPGAIPNTGDPAVAGIKKCSIGDQTFIFSFAAIEKNNQGGSKYGELSITDRTTSCNDANPSGQLKFPLKCTVDAGRNSTCIPTASVLSIPFNK